jgi:hypothetical protein
MAALTLGAPIPAILWSSLEDVLSTNMRLFAKDIAKTLGRPEAPLLQALQAEKIRPYIFEASEEKEIDMCCAVICVKPDAPLFLQPCGHPIVWNSRSRRCMEHLSYKPPAAPTSLPTLKRLEHTVEGAALYVSEDSTVYIASGAAVGQYIDGILTLFMVEDED